MPKQPREPFFVKKLDKSVWNEKFSPCGIYKTKRSMLRRIVGVMKEKLASDEELEPFRKHASQLAAIDYIVSVESDIFTPSYSGNMARTVEGHRRFLGHRKTISPDRKALVQLFDKIDLGTMKEGPKLSTRVIDIHRGRQGSPRKRNGPISGTKGMDRFRSEEAFYVNPLPDCLCQMEYSYTNDSHEIV